MLVLIPEPIMDRFNRYMDEVDKGGQTYLDEARKKTRNQVDGLIMDIFKAGTLLKAAECVAASSDAVIAFLVERMYWFERTLNEMPSKKEIELPADVGLLLKLALLDWWTELCQYGGSLSTDANPEKTE